MGSPSSGALIPAVTSCIPPVGGGGLLAPMLPAPPPSPLFWKTQASAAPHPHFPSLCLSPGLVSSAKASAAHLLSRPGGGLVVGGPLDVLEAKPRALSLRIRNQKLFVKLALEHG